MSSPWMALPGGIDAGTTSRRLHAARDRFLSGGRLDDSLRRVVADSWRRCLTGGAGAAGALPPVDLVDEALEEYRAGHPLASAMPAVRRLLVEDADEAGLLVAITDAHGRLLWVEGSPRALARAEGMHFVEGARWSEDVAGTNAPGTALALDHAVQIFAAEHLAESVTTWSCVAAPIHDPVTGALLGALDLTGGDDVAAPHAFTLVRAAAAAVEAELRLRHLAAPAPRRAPGRTSTLAAAAELPLLRVLGREAGELVTRSGATRLSLRHTELLLLLAHAPKGLTADQLAVRLHEHDDAAPVTLRAELSRLRGLLARLGGPPLLSRPYRLDGGLATDVVQVQRLIARGAHRRGLADYPGPVLPASQSPGVAELRDQLRHDLRGCVLAGRDADLLWTYAQSVDGAQDVEVWAACLAALPPSSRRRPVVAARLRRLNEQLAG